MASTAMADGKLDMSDVMRVAGGLMGGGNTGGTQQSGGLGGLLGGLFRRQIIAVSPFLAFFC